MAPTQPCPWCTHTVSETQAVTGSSQSDLEGRGLISSQEKPPSYTGDCASPNLLARFPLAPLAGDVLTDNAFNAHLLM